jgi:WD40 repeat protein
MSGRIWMMDIDSENSYALSNLQEIISEGAVLSVPTWSPDGNYIAYLNQSFNITFWHIDSKTPYVFDTKSIFPLHTNGYQWLSPGYFSWIE